MRFDSHLYPGYEIPSYYDSLIGKLICHGQTRQQAISKTLQALDELVIEGIKTNISMHRDVILADDNFIHEAQNIHYLERELLTEKKKVDSI